MPQLAKDERIRDPDTTVEEETPKSDETLDPDSQLLTETADDEEEEPMPGPRTNPPGGTI